MLRAPLVPLLLPAALAAQDTCGVVREVWVDGRRIPKNVFPDFLLEGRYLPGLDPRLPPPRRVLTILNQIRPEHVAEMTYQDCFDNAIHAVGGQMAVFVVLKDGIEYVTGRGTRVAEPRGARR